MNPYRRSRKAQPTANPIARYTAEWITRLRNSSRCSMRLMPGSSAWVRAERALLTRSSMKVNLDQSTMLHRARQLVPAGRRQTLDPLPTSSGSFLLPLPHFGGCGACSIYFVFEGSASGAERNLLGIGSEKQHA